MMKFVAMVFAMTLGGMSGLAAVYQVAKNGNDANPGTPAAPWLTIQRAANATVAGDIVRVRPGTYRERITETTDGTAAGPITYVADGAVVVDGGFYLNGSDFVRIIGFEITQTGTPNYPGVSLANAHHCAVVDCYIHHTYSGAGDGKAIQAGGGTGTTPCHSNVFRGNIIRWVGKGDDTGSGAFLVTGNRNLIEYNDVSHVGDYSNMWGTNVIMRNNYLHEENESDFSNDPPEGHHLDGWQMFTTSVPLFRGLMECNLMRSNSVTEGHFMILRNIRNDSSRDVIIRRNVYVTFAMAFVHVQPFTGVYIYNNTIARALEPAGNCLPVYYTDSYNSTNVQIVNNIFYSACTMTVYSYNANSQVGRWSDYNLRYLSGDPSPSERFGIEADPGFVSYASDLLQITNTSPAINTATPLTTAAGNGSGSSLSVRSNVVYFCDGYGVADGDWIVVGTNRPVQVTGINYATSTLTVTPGISWRANDAVWLASPSGRLDDIGAYEYRPGGYAFTATLSNSGLNYTVAVSAPDLVRMVVFYENGIPQAPDYSPPFTYTSSGGTVTAKAYARYADPNPVRTAVTGSGEQLEPAQNLRVVPN